MTVPPVSVLDAVVLAGGRARRLDGAAKPHVLLDGRELLAHVLDGLAASGLVRRVAVVGPPDVAVPSPVPLVQVQEDPPFGGPVAGIAAGLAVLDTAGPARAPQGTPLRADAARSVGDLVAVVACDVPGGARLLPALVDALQGAPAADGACARAEGRDQWLLAVYRRAALADALGALATERGELTGASVRGLVGGFDLVRVDDVTGASADVDTWADLDALHRPSDKRRPSD
ncbi:molybdenum cofactor guanylyltransferase [Sanguibacter hominis]|uniref:molybdenum cofactor guanylyltransferase n=1 Tax=Sanguibacter hominis TaxID=1312739 RepID=UPI003306CC16